MKIMWSTTRPFPCDPGENTIGCCGILIIDDVVLVSLSCSTLFSQQPIGFIILIIETDGGIAEVYLNKIKNTGVISKIIFRI